MIEKPAITAQAIDPNLAKRWSGRAFDPVTPVEDNTIIALAEAARWAPSCYGDQPWRYLIWNKYSDQTSWQQALGCLSPGNQQWAENAPILILAASVTAFNHNGNPNRWHGYDTGAASISLCLQATAMGLMSHQMGGFDADKLRSHFAIPTHIELWAMIAIGYPASLDSLTQEQLEREQSPRNRRPLTELFYNNRWNPEEH